MAERRAPLRSAQWFGSDDLNGIIHRGWTRAQGFAHDVFDGRPVIGIVNSWSEVANCNAHLRDVAAAVKRGVWRAGGFPLEMPAMSLSEPLMKPTTMLFRNLLAMEVEDTIRAYPLDAVVLLSSCDRTTPAMLRRRPARTCRRSCSRAVRCSAGDVGRRICRARRRSGRRPIAPERASIPTRSGSRSSLASRDQPVTAACSERPPRWRF